MAICYVRIKGRPPVRGRQPMGGPIEAPFKDYGEVTIDSSMVPIVGDTTEFLVDGKALTGGVVKRVVHLDPCGPNFTIYLNDVEE